MPLRIFLFLFCAAYLSMDVQAQESKGGEFSGNFQSNNQFYVRDDRIGANTIQYRRQKSSTDAWLFLNYKYQGFDITARYDLFNNSPLLNPQQAYTNDGVGYWSVKKSIGKLTITGGYFYDQFGTGAAFRAFEDRLIGIDYAVRGVRAEYQITDNWKIKAFTGQQKGFLDPTGADSRFTVSPQVVKGFYNENRFVINDDLNIDIGAGMVNRTLDAQTLNLLVSEINALPLENRFQPKSNAYVATGGATINYKNLSLATEYNYKTKEAFRDPFTTEIFEADGSVFFTSLSYSKKGLGINASYKRVETFQFRSSPYQTLLNGQVTYLPSITRQNVYRLLARYIPVVQELGEHAFAGDILWSPSKKLTMNINVSNVTTLGGKRLFQEMYIDGLYKVNSKLKVQAGVQAIFYSQSIYQLSPNAPDVYAFTPFTELTYKLTTKQSLRFEAQYMHTRQDLGSFVNAVLEYNFAPNWSFSVGDMINTDPVRTPGTLQEEISTDLVHYYNIFASYQMKSTRFTLNYLKQVQGVNCTGGICRVEPAFSGLRFGLITNF